MTRSRRDVLIAGAAGAGLVSLGTAAYGQTTSDFAAVRAKWKVMQTGGLGFNPAVAPFATIVANNDAAANGFWSSMNKSPTRSYLWNDQETQGSLILNTRVSCVRLKTMAIAYATNGSTLEGNATLLADIASALQFISTNRYNMTIAKAANWYDWEIGVPLSLLDALVVLDGLLPSALVASLLDAVERFSPSPTTANGSTATAANRTWKCQVVFVRGILVESAAKVSAAMNAMVTTFAFVVTGDGFHADGSFVQHSEFPYNGSYGASMLTQVSNLLYATQGTFWELGYAQWANVRSWVYDGFEPLIFKGAMMDMVRGREISRSNSSDHTSGSRVISAVTLLSSLVTGSDATNFKSMVKYWIGADTYRPFFNSGTVNLEIARLAQAIVANAGIALRGEILENRQYPDMARISHKRPTWAFGIACYSSDIKNYECINNENGRAWHTGSGMTYLYNDDLDHYADQYWPTVDPYRMPGTTIDKRARTFGQGQGTAGQAVVGGARVGQSGVACMQLSTDAGSLVAKKSWLMLGDYIVHLGAGITGTSTNAVETVVENRNIGATGTNVVTRNSTSTQVLGTLGATASLTGTNWINVAGVGGYAFPGSANLVGKREERSGDWQDINNNAFSPTTVQTRRYITLWYDHGVAPTNATYSYVFLPGATASATSGYAAAPSISILENSTTAQVAKGVYSSGALVLYGAIFWANAAKTVDVLSCNRIACVFVRKTTSTIEIGIADPTGTSTTNIVLTVNLPNSAVASADSGITVARTSSSATVTFNPTGTTGHTRSVFLNV